MAVLGLRFCTRAFSSCGKWGPLFIAVCGPLSIAASLAAEHRLQTCRLSNCGSRAQLLRGMWDPPRAGLEPLSPALAGRFSATAPPGKPSASILEKNQLHRPHQICWESNGHQACRPQGSRDPGGRSQRDGHGPSSLFAGCVFCGEVRTSMDP